ncbi:MAG: PQQ-binding-like beta-propeller repeat protein [Candidatus Bipolaricaulota bacterium]|nr:PQQ-binding-like beta-propeller repeat protein [Candidatus Bipolaricaulota bacterium]MDW8030380.1 PQQ-binding-like beta-propeller repeat protein [Candidatus Bipolaricaulota bacterium]
MGSRVRALAIALLLSVMSATSVGVGQSSGLLLVFRVPDSSPIRSSPVIDLAKNAIYFGADDGNLYAIPLVSAEQPRRPKWVFSPDPDPAKRRPMRVAPVIDEVRNRVYIGADDGKLYAVDRDTGQLIEGFTPAPNVSPPRTAPIRVPPSLDQPRGVLYVGADDQRVLAINAENGVLAGEGAGSRFDKAKGAIRAAPITDFVKSAIYFGSDDGKFYAIDREDFQKSIDQFPKEIGSPIRGSPLLDILGTEGAAIYFGADNGVFYAIDRNGKELYRFETLGPVRTKAAVDPVKNAIYFVSDDGRLYALFRSDEKDSKGQVIPGRERGKQKFAVAIVIDNNPNPFDGDLPRSSPVVDRRLGATGLGTIIVGSVDGNLYGIDPDSGRLRFALPVPGAGSDPRAVIRTTPALYVSGPRSSIEIYIGADDGGLYVARRP